MSAHSNAAALCTTQRQKGSTTALVKAAADTNGRIFMGNRQQVHWLRGQFGEDVDAHSIQTMQPHGIDERALFFDATAVHALCHEHERTVDQLAEAEGMLVKKRALIVDMAERIVALEGQVRAIVRYATHDGYCNERNPECKGQIWHDQPAEGCTCGLSTAMGDSLPIFLHKVEP